MNKAVCLDMQNKTMPKQKKANAKK